MKRIAGLCSTAVIGSTCQAQLMVDPGFWSGDWKNLTFGSTGPVTARLYIEGGNACMEIDAGGNVFGQPDPPPFLLTGPIQPMGITQFALSGHPTMGDLTVKIQPNGSIAAAGANVPSIFVDSYIADGLVTQTTIHLDGAIQLTGGGMALTTIDLGFVMAICRADCDGSGNLDLFDFLCFTNQFNQGNVAADCTCDGTLDLFDFLCFTNHFNAGCP